MTSTGRWERPKRRLAILLASLVGLVLIAVVGLVGFVFLQGRMTSPGDGGYVAMGSSFAAAPGVTTRAVRSPFACFRSNDDYAHILARMRELEITDVTCSGAVTDHVLTGGQLFQRAQIAAVRKGTRLVTVTIGGNDVFYVGSLLAWSCANRPTGTPLFMRLMGACKVKSEADVDKAFSRLEPKMTDIVARVHATAPNARVVFVDYTTVLPDAGTCSTVPLSEGQMQRGRQIGKRLKALTQKVAEETGSGFVAASDATHGHDVCSADPWVSGDDFSGGRIAYHPKLQAMKAIAAALDAFLDTPAKPRAG